MHTLPKIQQGTAWEVKDTDSIITKHLSEVYPVAFAKIMCNRGLYEVSAVEDFLHCALGNLPQHKIEESSFCNAADRILAAIRNNEKIVVYGDYDVDGVTSTALVTEVIRELGGEADYFIPNRLTDGYGLSAKRIKEMADRGVKLVITVDCGINAMEEVELLKERGVDCIITDHHEPKFDPKADLFTASGLRSFVLPNAYSVINPKIDGSGGGSAEDSGYSATNTASCSSARPTSRRTASARSSRRIPPGRRSTSNAPNAWCSATATTRASGSGPSATNPAAARTTRPWRAGSGSPTRPGPCSTKAAIRRPP